MSDIERGDPPGRQTIETPPCDQTPGDTPGGDISPRSAESVESVEEEDSTGGMESEGDPAA